MSSSGSPAGGASDPMLVADLEDALGRCYLYDGDYATVKAELGLAFAASEASVAVRSEVLSLVGMWHHYRAIDLDPEERSVLDHSQERSCFEEALELAGESNPAPRARALFGLGLVEQVLEGDLIRAAPRFIQAQAILDSDSTPSALLHSEVLRHVGFDHLLRLGDHTTAIELLTRSLRIREELPEEGWIATGHAALAIAHRLAGNLEIAIAYGEQAVEMSLRLRLRAQRLEFARHALEKAMTTRTEASDEGPKPRSS